MSTSSHTTFKKGMTVKFKISTKAGITKGAGVVKTLPPKNPGRGGARVTVKDADGREWRPFATQCST